MRQIKMALDLSSGDGAQAGSGGAVGAEAAGPSHEGCAGGPRHAGQVGCSLRTRGRMLCPGLESWAGWCFSMASGRPLAQS